MEKRKIKLIPIISFLLLILFAISGIGFLGFNNSYSLAEESQTGKNFYLNVYDRSGSLLLSETQDTFNGTTAHIYQWEDAKKFVFNIDASQNVPPTREEGGIKYYSMTIEVQYVQGYYEEVAWTNVNTLLVYSNTQYGDDSYLNFAEMKPELDIDQGVTGTDLSSSKQVIISTWGVYRFRLVINGQDTLSDYYVIEPTKEILEAPKVEYEITPSQTTLHNAFNFSLQNKDKYRYIDKSKLIWYVLGTANDGTTYALTFTDLNSDHDSFKDCSTALEETYARTGQTFHFDGKGIAGEWQVWCEYNFDGNPESTLKSNVTKVITGTKFDYSIIIWIVIAVAGLAIIVTISVSVYKVKREKVY